MPHVMQMELDGTTLAEILDIEDPVGVLSLYVDADPTVQASVRPAWAVELRNDIASLRDAARDGARERWTALEARLETLEDEIARLADPAEPGRGRALFAPLSGDGVRRMTLQGPLGTLAVLEDRAYVRPLVGAFDRGRPQGLVTLSKEGARVADLRVGGASELLELRFQEGSEDWREMKGPAGANPAMAQQTAPQRDRFARRVEDHRRRFLQSVAGRVAALAGDRGWERIVLAGDGRLAGPLEEELPADPGTPPVVRIERTLEGLTGNELATAVAEALAPEEQARHRAELERARAGAAADGTGALGLADVLAALAEGRVAHLLIGEDAAYRGLRAPDGRLAAPEALPPDVDPSTLSEEPRLGERMIELAVRTDADISVLTGAAADELAAAGGVAAMLRW